MGDTEEGNCGGSSDMMQRIQSSFGTTSSSSTASVVPRMLSSGNQLDNMPQLNTNQIRARHFAHFASSFGGDGGKRVGIPPSHPNPNPMPPISPYSLMPVSRGQMGSQGFSSNTAGPTHSRSLSQPSSFFSLDSLPPLSPSPFRDSPGTATTDQVSNDVSMEDKLPPSPFSRGNASRIGESLPPRNKHRRSSSDIPFGFSSVMQSSPPPLVSPRIAGGIGVGKPVQLVKKEMSWEKGGDNTEGMGERKSEGEVVDDLFSAYMNLDTIDALNSSGTDDKNGTETREDLDSRASGTKTNGGDSSDNEAESSVNESGNSLHRGGGISSSGEKREGVKRSAAGDVAPTSRHYRSVSMDSFMGKLNFGDESPKLPPSPGTRPGQLSPSNSVDANSPAFSLEFGNGEFSGAELKKIMANDKLAEIALTDPKRAKR